MNKSEIIHLLRVIYIYIYIYIKFNLLFIFTIENTKDVKIPMSITMELEKKKIVKSSEIENMKQEGKLAFTKDEIY